MHLVGPGSMKILVGSREGQEDCMPAAESAHLLYFQELGKVLNEAVKNLHSRVNILHNTSVFVQSRNTFAQSLCIKSSSLYICQKAQISTHSLPCTNGLQYLPLCLISLFIYLFFLHFLIPLLRWQDTKICLSKFFVCCGSPAVASW